MNLIVRITILFVLVSLVVFLIGGVISFNVMMREVNVEQQRFLTERLDRMMMRLERRPPRDTVKWTKMMVVPLAEYQKESISFSDTLVMHSQLERLESHLRLDAIRNVKGKSYKISLYDIIIEADDIRDGLTESLVTMYLILLGAVLIKALWCLLFFFDHLIIHLTRSRVFHLPSQIRRCNFLYPESKNSGDSICFSQR